jgi:starch synthase
MVLSLEGATQGYMRIVQAVWGVFHHFDLVRELERRGHLQRVYSIFPSPRLEREGRAPCKVRTFPWTHISYFIAGRYARRASDSLGYANTILFDEWVNCQLPDPGIHAPIGLSVAGLKTGKRLQQQRAIFLCYRGSTHQRYQERLVNEEFKHPSVDLQSSRTRDAIYEREMAMYQAAEALGQACQLPIDNRGSVYEATLVFESTR